MRARRAAPADEAMPTMCVPPERLQITLIYTSSTERVGVLRGCSKIYRVKDLIIRE